MSADDYAIPLTIKPKNFCDDYETKGIELVHGRAKKLKFQFPIYEDQDDHKIFWKLLRKF